VSSINQYFDEQKAISKGHVTAKQQAFFFNSDTMDLENKVPSFGRLAKFV
jgi:hypothetical protein